MSAFDWMKDAPRVAAVVKQWPMESFGAMTDEAVRLERELAEERQAYIGASSHRDRLRKENAALREALRAAWISLSAGLETEHALEGITVPRQDGPPDGAPC